MLLLEKDEVYFGIDSSDKSCINEDFTDPDPNTRDPSWSWYAWGCLYKYGKDT